MKTNSNIQDTALIQQVKDQKEYVIELFSFIPYYVEYFNPSRSVELFLLEYMTDENNKLKALSNKLDLIKAGRFLKPVMN